jgi:hypothetical protein
VERLVEGPEAGGDRLGRAGIDLGAAGDEPRVHELVGQDAAEQDMAIRVVVERVLASGDGDRIEVSVLREGEDGDGPEALGLRPGGRVELLLGDDVGLLGIQQAAGGPPGEEYREGHGGEDVVRATHRSRLPVRSPS